MAAASYTTDLTAGEITLAESTTGWTALGGGASGLGIGVDFAMQGTNCVDKQISAAEKGHVYDPGANQTIASGRHVFTWVFLATPGLADTLANRGLTIAIGSSTTAYCKYHVEGNNTYGAAGRVAKCYPVDPSVFSANTGSSPYRTQVGTPSGAYRVFGALANITGTAKAANLGIDAIRHGTGVFVTGGDGADADATFAGLQSTNDNISNRWGVFTGVGGGYELQGKLYIGRNSAGTATVCVFTDSNVSLTIPENPHVSSTFNEIVVDHASTVLTLSNVTVQSLGATSPGGFTVTTNNPTVSLTGCNFIGMGAFTFRAATTATGCAFRGSTGALTLNGGTLDGCVLADFTAATTLIATPASMANVTDCTFESDGSNHAVDLGTVSASTSFNWNNFATGYAAANGSTGNETILVNVASGQTLTINVGAGYTTPSVYNTGTGTVSVVAGQVTTTITVRDAATGTVIQNARVYLIAGAGGPLSQGTVIFNDLTDSNGQVSDIRSLASDQPVTGWVRKGSAATYYKTSPISATIDNASGLSLTVQMVVDA
jgi:hypothetical protein